MRYNEGMDILSAHLSSNLPALQQEYVAVFNELEGDLEGRVGAQRRLMESTAIYHDSVIGFGYLPKLYDTNALHHFNAIATTMYGIIAKVIARFDSDPAYRELFGFPPLLEHLVCLPTGYDCAVPITRFDFFLNEETLDFQFCEINTDGTSAMNEDREVVDALALTSTFAHASQHHDLKGQELFDPWVEEFLRIYHGARQAVPDPVVAIVDYTESATMYEFEEFRTRFERAGCRCIICDMSSLAYQDSTLYGTDVNPAHPAYDLPLAIDAVYRRAVTSEVLAELTAAPASAQQALKEGRATGHSSGGAYALVQAATSEAVCLIGGFRTNIAHCKQFFTVLHDARTGAFLSAEECGFIRKHVPYTTNLSNKDIDLNVVRGEKDRWIIKPRDGYGSVGVYAGVDLSQEAWEEAVDTYAEGPYVVQSYCRQFATPNTRPVPVDNTRTPLFTTLDGARQAQREGNLDPQVLEPWNILTGIYVYGGTFSGVYVRAGQQGIIVGFAGGITLGSYLVDYDPASAGLAVRTRVSHG